MTEEQELLPSLPDVRNWALRPRRTPKPVKTYWEEYVETDEWYKQKLCEDIPDDEIMAAFFDENFSKDEGEEGEDDEEGSEEQEEEDPDFLMQETQDDGEPSDCSSEGSEGSEATESSDETGEQLSGDGLDCTDSEWGSGDEYHEEEEGV